MSHYEERLEADLRKIKALVARMGEEVEVAVRRACRALLTKDDELAATTILGDIGVNNDSRELDRLCHVFVALHVPSAGHLRYVSSVLRLSIALERIGDYAETISRTAVQLSTTPPRAVAADIQIMADQSCRTLHQAMAAFNAVNAEQARATLELSGQFATTSDKVYADLLAEGEKGERPLNDLFSMLATFNRLERIIHQAKNICEETIFAATGATKEPKKFDILFLDERNDGASQLAEFLARKVYPSGGEYASAGWAPAARVDPDFVRFADEHGLDLSQARPSSYGEEAARRLADYDIVVALEPHGRAHIAKLPFHTVFLQWSLEEPNNPRAAYSQLAGDVSALMERLRGKR